ncbi:MAG: MFS transporter, partial [Thiohalocapsa sp.]
RDLVIATGATTAFGLSFSGPALGYAVVYILEIFLLIASLVVIAPLAMRKGGRRPTSSSKFGITEMP